jgi:alginate O-acetyltransferase complex protein AlgI
LGGSKGGTWMKVRNTFIIFLVSGFWHGANWTFIVWGLLNAIYIMPSIVLSTNRNHLDIVAKGNYFPTIRDFLLIGLTFGLTVFAWIFFRAENLSHAMNYISGIFSFSFFTLPEILPFKTILLVVCFMFIEWIGREQQYALASIGLKWPKTIRYAFYYSIILLIVAFGGTNQQFIYFQF